MLTTMMKTLMIAICCLTTPSLFAATPQIVTKITFNGEATKTYFNDGDTFKILDGSLRNARVRIAGFNTLETYGPIHKWMENDPNYLFTIAKQATAMAQGGQWTCESDGKKDTYGRMLAVCDDLALALIEAGLAHAYSVDEKSADRKYITSQRTAKSKRLGIWQHGIPEYIITSLHSADEGSGAPYNRLISTTDGHTKKWSHKDTYQSCERVCVSNEASCMVYVPFEERYGNQRPKCLR